MSNTVNFGSDMSCVSDLLPAMTVVSGRRLVAEAIARRLQTPRGALLDDSLYGFDVTALLNADIGPGDIGRIQAGVNAECLKDQRVASATCTATWVGPGSNSVPTGVGYLQLSIALVTAGGPFTLVLAVTQVTVAILQTGT